MPPLSILPSEIAADPQLNVTDLRVVIALASYANAKSRECFPSQSRLARELGISRQTVNRAIGRLSKTGWITSTPQILPKRGQTANRYCIRLPGTPAAGATPVADKATPAVPADATAQKEHHMDKQIHLSPTPIDEHWVPNANAQELALGELGFRKEELDDAISEYRAYWRDRSDQPSGCKSDWNGHFRGHLRRLASAWRTHRRRKSQGPGRGRQRAGG
ncbi:MAG: hypothetical protein CMF75_02395, partial [Maricaulis sp.]|nr:hypothetical protein [Maricaulis sp.]